MATDLLPVRGQLAATATALLTAGTNQTIQINKVDLFNDSGSDVANIIFYLVPSGGSADATTSIYKIGSLADDKSRNVPISGQTLRDGDALYAIAGTATAVNYSVAYQKITG